MDEIWKELLGRKLNHLKPAVFIAFAMNTRARKVEGSPIMQPE
jgi:hypothetical protein